MVSMLDERDKLVDSLKNEQEKTTELEVRSKSIKREGELFGARKLHLGRSVASSHGDDETAQPVLLTDMALMVTTVWFGAG